MGAEKDRGGERGEKQKGKEGVMPNHNRHQALRKLHCVRGCQCGVGVYNMHHATHTRTHAHTHTRTHAHTHTRTHAHTHTLLNSLTHAHAHTHTRTHAHTHTRTHAHTHTRVHATQFSCCRVGKPLQTLFNNQTANCLSKFIRSYFVLFGDIYII
jgi:hypothetical protein